MITSSTKDNLNHINKLYSFTNNEKTSNKDSYSLDNVKKILLELGNPQDKIKTVHIAGTNGKGSTAYFLNSIMIKSGYKCGIYTSPHLLKINERIAVNETDISDYDLNLLLGKIISIVEKLNLPATFFDLLTCTAFQYFYEQKVDVCIIETGLGGRLDSTNVITPMCSLITQISLDHTQILGETLTEITREKAGIIKENVPVLTNNTNEEILSELSLFANTQKSPFYIMGQDFVLSSTNHNNYNFKFDSLNINFEIDFDKLKYKAPHYLLNMSLAIACISILMGQYPRININSLLMGIYTANIPGRFQCLKDKPKIIFDPAHNPNAMEQLALHIKNTFPHKTIHIILAIMEDKDFLSIIEILKKYDFKLYYCLINDDRLYKLSKKDYNYFNGIIEAENLNTITSNFPQNDIIVFTGTFKLYEYASQL